MLPQLAEAAERHTIEQDFRGYTLVDQIPLVAEARMHARAEAYEVVEQNRQLLREGQFDRVAMPVDALGTARRVVGAKEGSLEAVEAYQGLVLDCQRLVAEARRKNTWEYFEPLRQHYDAQADDYVSHGFRMSEITKAGLTPTAEAEEIEIRVNDHVEERTYSAIRSLGGLALGGLETKVRTVSPCADWAIAALESGSKTGYGGNAPEIRKFMVRDVKIDPFTGDRIQEQIAVSGLYITESVHAEVMARKGVEIGASKQEIHQSQTIVDDDLLDYMSMADQIASRRSGKTIFMGEVVPEGTAKDYSLVRRQAAGRLEETNKIAVELAEFVYELAEAETESWLAVGLVEARTKKLLFRHASNNVSEAALIFDEQTAQGLEAIVDLQRSGQVDLAQQMLEQVESAAPPVSFCGAGSCGLEGVSSGSKEGKELAKKLGAEATDEIVKDTERACRCGKKSIVYAYNKQKVTKHCQSCGAFETKIKQSV